MHRDKEDLQLIDRVLAGEQKAYASLVDHYKAYAFTLALRILNNRSDAEEAAQDAFVRAYRHLETFNRQSKFSTWFYRIVFNTAISHKRKQKKPFHEIEKIVIAYEHGAEGHTERKDRTKFLHQALEKLTEADKLAITLFYLKEFSLEEIGNITGMQPNTIKVRIHRARTKLAEELKNILKREALTL